MLSIIHVLCEYQEHPLGTDQLKPRLSWELSSEDRAITQTAYHIQLSTDSSFTKILADSEKNETNQSVQVELPTFEAAPFTRYFYRVKVWSNANESDWQEGGWFETGMLSESNWQAKWITHSSFNLEPEQAPRFRKDFDLEGKRIKEARLYTTATGLYEARLNGNRISNSYFAPGWTDYKARLQYQTYDVTHLIAQSQNVLAFTLGKGWYRGNLAWSDQKDIYGDQSSLLAEMHIHFEEGESVIIPSDLSWTAGPSPILRSEIYHGETYDARLEQPNWDQAGFEKEDWSSVVAAKTPPGQIIAQEYEPVRKQEQLKPIERIRTPNGETVLDFGQNMVG